MNPVIVVQLTQDEVLEVQTYVDALRDRHHELGHQDKMPGKTEDELRAYDLRGRIGEYAVAKHLGLEYQYTLGYEANRDVHGYEVRTRGRHHYDLPTYDTDRDGIYILASTMNNRLVMLHGWTTLREANHPDRYADWLLRPCYLTTRDKLYPMAFLPSPSYT
jgi:hypothetical protein